MVTFVCGRCNESLKKQKVNDHWHRCHNDYVSCIDCSVDFYGDEFDKHVKCVSEREKYGGANFDKAKGLDKGDRKQSDWTDKVQELMEGAESNNMSALGKRTLEFIKDYSNIPRKKKKFCNFIKNTCKWSNEKAIEEVWAVFDVKKETVVAATKSNTCSTTCGTPVKRKADEPNPEIPVKQAKATLNPTDNFKWKRQLKKILRENGLKMKVTDLVKVAGKVADTQGINQLSESEILEKISKIKNALVENGKVVLS